AKKKADEERARQEAEAKRLADAAAKKKADEERARQETEAKRAEEARIAAAETARREADTSKSETAQQIAAVLKAEERATFVTKMQEGVKERKCYEGAINGSSDDAQKSLDRYIKSARLRGKEKPARIELAKATAGDFDSWLKEADDIKGGLCVPPPERAERKPLPSKPHHR